MTICCTRWTAAVDLRPPRSIRPEYRPPMQLASKVNVCCLCLKRKDEGVASAVLAAVPSRLLLPPPARRRVSGSPSNRRGRGARFGAPLDSRTASARRPESPRTARVRSSRPPDGDAAPLRSGRRRKSMANRASPGHAAASGSQALRLAARRLPKRPGRACLAQHEVLDGDAVLVLPGRVANARPGRVVPGQRDGGG